MAGFGLRLARSQGMEGYTGNLTEYDVSPANALPIFTGDPVILNGGFLTAATSTSAAILGIFMGCRYVDSHGDFKYRNYWDGNTGAADVKAAVAVPPHGRCWIKGEAGVDFQQASIGAAHPFVINAGNAQYGDSRWTVGAAGAGPLIVHRLVDLPKNVWGTDEPILEVTVNLSAGYFSDAA